MHRGSIYQKEQRPILLYSEKQQRSLGPDSGPVLIAVQMSWPTSLPLPWSRQAPSPAAWTPALPSTSPPAAPALPPAQNMLLPDAASCSRHFPPEVLVHVLKLLPSNDVAYAGRLVCKDAAQLLLSHSPPDPPAFIATAKVELLREPLPASMPLQEATERIAAALQKLTHFRRLRALPLSVVSGSTTSMDIVWTLLRRRLLLPGRTPRQLGEAYRSARTRPDAKHCPDPGTVACRKGEPPAVAATCRSEALDSASQTDSTHQTEI